MPIGYPGSAALFILTSLVSGVNSERPYVKQNLYAFPSVSVPGTCSNDTDFGSLWGLNNTQYPDIDINACDAWQITQGEGIKVAVFDNRVDINHNDLKNNILTDKYYDIATKTPTDPNATPIIENPDHGTHVAGIIAAIKNNNLQVAGVAPSSN